MQLQLPPTDCVTQLLRTRRIWKNILLTLHFSLLRNVLCLKHLLHEASLRHTRNIIRMATVVMIVTKIVTLHNL